MAEGMEGTAGNSQPFANRVQDVPAYVATGDWLTLPVCEQQSERVGLPPELVVVQPRSQDSEETLLVKLTAQPVCWTDAPTSTFSPGPTLSRHPMPTYRHNQVATAITRLLARMGCAAVSSHFSQAFRVRIVFSARNFGLMSELWFQRSGVICLSCQTDPPQNFAQHAPAAIRA